MKSKLKITAVIIRVMIFLAVFLSWVPVQQNAAISVAKAATSTLSLQVLDATTAASVDNYSYIINIDNTATTDQKLDASGNLPAACDPAQNPSYPTGCNWISTLGSAGSSPIFTQGDQSDFQNGGISLPDGRYLVSVVADGYKIDGAHFTVPLEDPGLVTVLVQPNPLPDATIQAAVFEDVTPTNSAPDVPAERGLAGFVGHITDYLGEVTTDVYGGPLCDNGICVSKCYVVNNGEDIGTVAPIDADGRCPVGFTTTTDPLLPADITQTQEGTPIPTGAAIEGKIKIPNVGPNRYALSAVAPNGTNWIQTTTLEGNHDWDAWVMEGATGLDTEFVVAGEPFPAIFFGFVPGPAAGQSSWRDPNWAVGSGSITGVIAAFRTYVPAKGGVIGGEPMLGSAVDHVIDSPWLSLVDIGAGDTAVWIGQGNPDGSFTIPNVPDGNYTLAYWDEPQDYILNILNVTVANGEVVDLGVQPLSGWWTYLDGYVFNDLNGNGKKDDGEPGLANFPVAMKKRENSLMDRGSTTVTTDANGYYFMENAYPITQWLVMEAYNDSYKTVGITYQADNQPAETTILGAGVDVSVLPIIGLSGRLDWGLQPYGPNENGGIVGTVSYDTTRNELDPRFAFVEDWQPGVSNIPVYLYAPVLCNTNPGTACDKTGRYELAPDGSFAKGQLLNSYLTETWKRPTNCVARDVNGDPLAPGIDVQSLPYDPYAECLEAPLMGVQFGAYETGQGTSDANFGATVDGNYGFGDACFNGTLDATDPANPVCVGGQFSALTPADYLVDVAIPTESQVYSSSAAHPDQPLYQFTKEEDINIFNGDQFIPAIPPPECAGPLHTVDVAGVGTDGYPATPVIFPGGTITVTASTPVVNTAFADAGGSVYEGQQRPLCDVKLVRVSNGRSVAPTFNVFTNVPLPGRFWGLIVDDLNFSSDPRSLMYGEKAGVPFAPVGIYDYTNRLVYTTESDFNGLYDVLLPSTTRINCPTPSGVCANLYRFVGNDPGTPGNLNPNYNPQFRTIAAEFEAFPGLLVPADLAPTQMAATIQLPGTQTNVPVVCTVDSAIPQLFAVSQPYMNVSGGSFTITGQGFGAAVGQVTLDGSIALPTTSWNDSQIVVNVPAGTAVGPHQLDIRAAGGSSLTNGLTFHVLGAAPFNALLDNFDRANGALGANWGGNTGTNIFRILSNQAQARTPGAVFWNPSLFGSTQQAYVTLSQISTVTSQQGVLLKLIGSNASQNASSWIEVAYNGTNNTVAVWTKRSGVPQTSAVQQAVFNVSFASGNILGARTYPNGLVEVYKNGALVGSVNVTTTPNPWPASLASGGGRIGLRTFANTNTIDVRFDNFGGSNFSSSGVYQPNLYEVGSGKPYSVIQDAVDAAAASAGDDLVVVYPGQPDPSNPRVNPRGAYFENLIVSTPIKLQGVGPGGVIAATNTTVPGSIIDGGGFAGDTALADAWRARIATLTWLGNQTVFEGETILMLSKVDVANPSYFPSIDGLQLRGGDQNGQLNTINQGGAIFANAYVRSLHITNNVVENNSGSYGTVRFGTPDLLPPETNQHNENAVIAHNRIIANAGTNLAGGIGLFAGSDSYDISFNDICGNFSAEYGGGISIIGYSPNGKIHDNRIYFNQSYDEGAGIMIAGTLPADPSLLSPGSGPVDIFNNLIQGNVANDDGGGIRFLMAGNFTMNVYNNMIVNNVSTHEGGGIALDDAPNVRIYNNTIMKNITTATAVTSNGFPAPAGLSTTSNSAVLQATLPAGSPLFSNPLLFNNIFWDNRAGTLSGGTVTGLSDADAYIWDLGVADDSGQLSPTNSILQQTAGYVADASNLVGIDPAVVLSYTTTMTFAPWRTNPNFVGSIMVTVDVAPNLLGNYHLTAGSAAINAGAASKVVGAVTVNAPAVDFDRLPRTGNPDIGADEY